jgi:hypothetical protein
MASGTAETPRLPHIGEQIAPISSSGGASTDIIDTSVATFAVEDTLMQGADVDEIKHSKSKRGRKAKASRKTFNVHGEWSIRVRQNNCWVEMDALGLHADVVARIKAQVTLMATDSKMATEFRRVNDNLKDGKNVKGRIIPYVERKCAECVVMRRNRNLCKWERLDYAACAACSNNKSGLASPCAHLFEENGTAFVGFVPLPEHMRQGKQWGDVGYWINQEPSKDEREYESEGNT